MPAKLKPLEPGEMIGHWVAVAPDEPTPHGGARWRFRCICGRLEMVRSPRVLRNAARAAQRPIACRLCTNETLMRRSVQGPRSLARRFGRARAFQLVEPVDMDSELPDAYG